MSATDDNRTAKQRKGTAAKLANIVLGVGQFGYATDTKVTKVGDGVTTFAMLPTIGGGASYLKYLALLSETGTDDPVATVLENTIGSMAWTRIASGEYNCTGPINFPTNETFGFIAPNNGGLSSFQYYADGSSEILLITVDEVSSLQDDLLFNSSIEIRVYP